MKKQIVITFILTLAFQSIAFSETNKEGIMTQAKKFYMGEEGHSIIETKMKSKYISISKEELNKSYPEISTKCNEKDLHFILFPDGATIDGTLDINPVQDYDGIIVIGDLKVNGNIVNSNNDYGTTLIVSGDTYADNLIAGGSVIDLSGNVYIKYLCLAHYNGGTLYVDKLHTQLLINDDHATGIKDSTAIEAEFNTYYHGTMESNQFDMTDLGIFFPDKPWIEKDTDQDEENEEMGTVGYNYFFSSEEFMEHELTNTDNIDNIIQHIKTSIEEQKQIEDSYFKKGIASTDQMYRFLLRKINIPLYSFATIPKNSNIKLVKGDYEIEDDLILDKEYFSSKNICMLLIDGDLKVKGSLYNSNKKEGIVLFVTGSVYCTNLLLSTSEIFINKDLVVDNILLCRGPGIDIDSWPKLEVKKIKSASLAIIESGYELGNRFGSDLKNKVFTAGEERKEYQFLIKHLEKILDEKYWSKKDEYIDEENFLKAVVQNKPVLKSNYKEIITTLPKKK